MYKIIFHSSPIHLKISKHAMAKLVERVGQGRGDEAQPQSLGRVEFLGNDLWLLIYWWTILENYLCQSFTAAFNIRIL